MEASLDEDRQRAGEEVAVVTGKRGRRNDRERVEAGRVAVAKLPGTAVRITRAEAAGLLCCSIRQLQRFEQRGKLARCPQFGREVSYLSRDVRALDLALREGR